MKKFNRLFVSLPFIAKYTGQKRGEKKKAIFALQGFAFAGRSSSRSGKRRPPVRAGFSIKEATGARSFAGQWNQ
jgi:hypothetical protein